MTASHIGEFDKATINHGRAGKGPEVTETIPNETGKNYWKQLLVSIGDNSLIKP
jgi:hypothetical protein